LGFVNPEEAVLDTNQTEFANAWATANGLVELRRPSPAAGLQALADRFAIIETIQTYGWSVDERRMDIFADLFANDATFDIVIAGAEPVQTPSGRDAIVTWMSDYMDALDFQMRHRMGNVLVTEQSGDAATALSYLLLTATTPERTEPMATACYTWRLVREDDAWRVAHISAAFDRMFG
jgi:ketosteroid isomerase-like protein